MEFSDNGNVFKRFISFKNQSYIAKKITSGVCLHKSGFLKIA
jgi:hypothetical protein